VAKNDKLMMFGISGREARVYDALLRVERAKVQELARMVSIPRPHIYPALTRLMERGMVTAAKGSLVWYSAVNPELVLNQALERDRAAMDEKKKLIEELTRTFAHRKTSNREPSPIEVQITSPAQFGAIRKRMRNAQREMLSLMGRQMIKARRSNLNMIDEIEHSVLRRGVSVRCVYSRAAFKNPVERSRMRDNIWAGEAARVCDLVPLNLLVVDDDLAVISVPGRNHQYTVYRVNSPHLVALCRFAFEFLWQQGQELSKAELLKTDRKK
jgi:sugar-specific transcriptional regulator TrmB